MQHNLIETIKYNTKKLELIFYNSKYRKFFLASLFIFFYVLFYFLIDFSSQSLVAHDEGLYARRARLISESNNWFVSPFDNPHHKTLGSYWFLALAIKFLGYSEFSLRFTSISSSFICLILCYFISSKVLNKSSALITILSLSSMPLWIQYSRYASPDIPFVLSILLLILFFICYIESPSKINKFYYIYFAGFFISIAFFIRSYMVFIPLIGLSPFILLNLFNSKNIYKTIFFIGFISGLLPTFINIYFAVKSFGIEGLTSLYDFARNQATGSFNFNHFILIPINFIFLTFPVGVLIVLFLIFTKRLTNTTKYPLLVYLYPLISLFILLCMSTSYPHYFLFLLPSLSILFSLIIRSYSFRFAHSERFIKYSLLSFLILNSCILILILIIHDQFFGVYNYRNTLLIYISSFILIFSYLYSLRFLFKSYHTFQTKLLRFFMSIIIPQYISLSILYNFGVLGNPNNNTKLFLNDQVVSRIINSNTIYLYKVNSKIQTLLSYYIPSSEIVESYNEINQNQYLLTSDISNLTNEINSNHFEIISYYDDQILLMRISK